MADNEGGAKQPVVSVFSEPGHKGWKWRGLLAAVVLLLVGTGLVVIRKKAPPKPAITAANILQQAQNQAAIDQLAEAAAGTKDATARSAALVNVASRYVLLDELGKAGTYARLAVDSAAPEASVAQNAVLTLADVYARQKKFDDALTLLRPLVGVPGGDDRFTQQLNTAISAYEANSLPSGSRPCEPTPQNQECKL